MSIDQSGEIEGLAARYMSGRLSRRAFIGQMFATGLSITAVVAILEACSPSPSSSSSQSGGTGPDPDTEIKNMASTVYVKGPDGEAPAASSALTFTDTDLTTVKGKKARVAISMHTGGDDFTAAQVAGMQKRCSELGFTIVGITNANFMPTKQIADLQSLASLKPDLLFTIPTEAQSMAATYAKLVAAGIPIVYGGVRMTGVPRSDFVSLISADNYGNGVASGFLMAKALNKKGKVGNLFWDVSVGTADRHHGYLKALSNYPDIKVIKEQDIAGPDFETSAQSAANAILVAHSDVQALWTVWDVPGAGAVAAARALNRTNMIVITEDLGLDAAVSIAQKGFIKGTGAQRPQDMGIATVNAGAYHLLGKEPPPFIVVPAFAVDRSNVLQAYQQIYAVAPPKALTDAYAQGGG